MADFVRVHLGGHLSWYDSDKRSWLDLDARSVLATRAEGLPASITPSILAGHLGLPSGEIALVAVNGRVVNLDAVALAADDTIEFYPPIGGG
jgi:molybdopterin converting factor small subunit